MNNTTNPQKNSADTNEQAGKEKEESSSREKQQQSDPNITELKGFVDPKEDLEPKGTDNDTSLT